MIKPIVLSKRPNYDYIEENKKYLLLVFTLSQSARYLVEVKKINQIGSEIYGLDLKVLKCFTKDRQKCKVIERLTEYLKDKIEITDKDNLLDLQKDMYLKSTYYPDQGRIKNALHVLQNYGSRRDDSAIRDAIYNEYKGIATMRSSAPGFQIYANKVGALLFSYSEGLHERVKTNVYKGLTSNSSKLNSDVAKEIVSYLGGKRKSSKSKYPKRKCKMRKTRKL